MPLRAFCVLIIASQLLACVGVAAPLSGTVLRITKGAELPWALGDSRISTIEINDINLQDEDWNGLQLPIVLKRNVTIRGAPSLGYMPLFDLNYVANKLQLISGMELVFEQLVIVNGRAAGLVRAAPGLDIFADSPMPEPGQARPVMTMRRAAFVQRLCQPEPVQVPAQLATPRPPELPGKQTVALEHNPPMCIYTTAGFSTMRIMDWCYPVRLNLTNIATVSVRLDAVGRQIPTNYLVQLLETHGLCAFAVETSCLANRTSVQCWSATWEEMVANGSARMPIWNLLQLPGDAANHSRSGQGGGTPAYAIACSAVLGGLAVAIALVFALAWYRRHTRQEVLVADAREQSDSKPPTNGSNGMPRSSGGGAGADAANTPAAGPAAGPIALDDVSVRVAGGQVTPAEDTSQRTGVATPRFTPSFATLSQAASCRMVTNSTPLGAHVRLDLRWGVDVVADAHAMRGAGAFGRVLEGTCGGERVAVKVLHLSPQHRARPQAAALALRQELDVLGRCSHPNVVRVMGAVLEPPCMCLVMELMDQSLEQLLDHTEHNRLLPLQQVLSIAIDVASGLSYLHPTIVHRDLKPANVLLDEHGTAKLSDFGMARLRETVCETRHPGAGTATYMAPECFDPQNCVISHKADIYSFAMLLWELLAGEMPWKGYNPMAIAFAVAAEGRRPALTALPARRFPTRLRELLGECWDADPLRRPSAEEVVKRLVMVTQSLAVQPAAAALAAAGASGAGSSSDNGNAADRTSRALAQANFEVVCL